VFVGVPISNNEARELARLLERDQVASALVGRLSRALDVRSAG
jgi:hypothetical protein